MKKYKMMQKLLVMICLGLVSIGTSFSQGKAKKDYALLTGKIINYSKNDSISLMDNADKYFGRNIKVKPDGSFTDTIRYKTKIKSRIIMMMAGEYNMYVMYFKDYEDLHIVFDIKNETSKATYKGKYAHESDYLTTKEYSNSLFQQNGMNQMYSLKEEAFIKKNRELTDGHIAKAKKAGLRPEFLKRELRELEYTYYFNFFYYPNIHGYMVAGDENYEPAIPLPSIKDDTKLSLNNPEDFMLSRTYSELLKYHFLDEILNKIDPDGTKEMGNEQVAAYFIKGLPEYKLDEVIQNGLVYSTVLETLQLVSSPEVLYKLFMKLSTNKIHRDNITGLYNSLQKTAKGKKSPKFVNYENFKGGTVSLDDLKGKYVLIDVWATWCGPCVKELPYLQKLEKKYHSKNIEFVSISVDEKSAYKKWKELIAKKEMGGLQLIADKAFDSDFVQAYQIAGIPRFILLDPKGIIVESNAPRPSDPKLDKLLAKLLN